MARYFKDCRTLEDVKAEFRDLAKRLHPDNGGSEAEFKAMMADYERAFRLYKDVHAGADGETYERRTTETPEQFASVIGKVIGMDGVRIEIIGSWVWLTGNTYHYRDEIRAAGFFWSRSKRAWYYNGEPTHRRRGHYSMKGLRARWGSTEVENEGRRALATA